jgi:hypothetical protein
MHHSIPSYSHSSQVTIATYTMQRLRMIRAIARTQCRTLSSTPISCSSWSPGPAPPRLPKEEQELFEKLQRQSAGAFSTPAESAQPSLSDLRARINQSPDSAQKQDEEQQVPGQVNARVEATGEGEELHPHIRRGAKPEFEGDVNPVTGEVGGPKNEPLRWGHTGDWSYNGRVTDF